MNVVVVESPAKAKTINKYLGSAYTVLAKVAIMIPVGFFFGLMLRDKDTRRGGIVRGLAWGVGFAAMVEIGQMFVYSRYTSTTDILLGSLGAAVGLALSHRVGPAADRCWLGGDAWSRWSRVVKPAALLVWLAAMVWQKCTPFEFTWPADFGDAIRRFISVPLARQYTGSEFLNASHVVREFVCFAILGLLAGSLVRRSGPRAKLAVAALTAGVAFLLEFSQIFLPRLADMTAALIDAAGGFVGVRLFAWFHAVFLVSPQPHVPPPDSQRLE